MRGADAERVADATHVLTGGEGTGAVRSILYAAYVALLVAASYGFTVVQALLRTSDPAWLHDRLASPITWLVVAALVVVTVGLAHAVARVRGPVVPPVPWTDLVVSSGNDRAVTLRRWWLTSLALVVIGAALVGGVLGGAAAYAGIGSAVLLIVGLLVGGAVGIAIALGWLSGQARISTGRVWTTPRAGLRDLRVDDLRDQAARSAVLGGSLLSGDLRAARFEMTTPVHRLRGRRLRHRGPFGTVVARDLLGLRRSPGGPAVGAVVGVIAYAGAAWGASTAAAPLIVPAAAALLLHPAVSAFGEGLRLQADNAGSPPLLGIPRDRELAAHATVVLAVAVVGALVVFVPVAVALGMPAPRAAVCGALLALVGTGSVTTASFRGPMARPPFTGSGIPTMLIGWYAFPSLICGIVGAVVLAHVPGGTLGQVAFAALVAVAPLLLGERLSRRLARLSFG